MSTSKTHPWWLPLDWEVYVGHHWLVTCDSLEDITEYEDGSRFKQPCRGHEAKGPGENLEGPDPGPREEEGEER